MSVVPPRLVRWKRTRFPEHGECLCSAPVVTVAFPKDATGLLLHPRLCGPFGSGVGLVFQRCSALCAFVSGLTRPLRSRCLFDWGRLCGVIVQLSRRKSSPQRHKEHKEYFVNLSALCGFVVISLFRTACYNPPPCMIV